MKGSVPKTTHGAPLLSSYFVFGSFPGASGPIAAVTLFAMSTVDAVSLNRALEGLTAVGSLLFESGSDGVCTITLILASNSNLIVGAAEVVCFTFTGVSHLSVKEFGGGLTQVMCLRCKDIRDQQMDRLNFEIEDLEDKRLFFRCRACEINI